MDTNKADIGVIGLAVMGKNLALNMADKGFRVCVYNRTTSNEFLLQEFLASEESKVPNIFGAHTLELLVENLTRPRRILLMISAGKPVDEVLAELSPLLEQSDIIMDGGNSEQSDTTRRCQDLRKIGLLFMGVGVSGGEEGARHGPSLMPGGNSEAWPYTKDILQAIAAKVNGKSCCSWIGEDGAGHYIKTVHNGIGYADMQLLAEAYHMLKDIVRMNPLEISQVFHRWNEDDWDWRLLQNTADILKFKTDSGEYLIDKIRDAAGQKGTGKWALIEALEAGIPVNVISESVAARCLSALKEERVKASTVLVGPEQKLLNSKDCEILVEDIRNAVYASKIVLYAQGFMLLRERFPKMFGNQLDCVELAHMWRGGCVIRSVFLDRVKEAFKKDAQLKSLLMDDYFCKKLAESHSSWRRAITTAINYGVPVPAFSSALAYYDGYRCPRLPANLLQAQRDFYGAHTYELLEQPGVFHHTEWTKSGKSN